MYAEYQKAAVARGEHDVAEYYRVQKSKATREERQSERTKSDMKDSSRS